MGAEELPESRLFIKSALAFYMGVGGSPVHGEQQAEKLDARALAYHLHKVVV